MNTPFDVQSSFYIEVGKIAKERDEWRKVADLLAAELDELTHGLGDSDALTKFKELEKKYPL